VYYKTETLVGAFILLAISLFVYMSFQLGSVRLNLARYATYTATFKEVSSLLPKADIKISGVKVGWVESVYLDPEDMRVKVVMKVLKEYKLYKDARALIRQEGMLGAKFLEMIPGTSQMGRILPGGSLQYQEQTSVGVDEMLSSVNALVKQIERLGTSLEKSTDEARDILQSVRMRLSKIDQLFSDMGKASDRFQETALVIKQAGEQVNELLSFGDVSKKDAQGLVKKLTQGQGSLTKLLTDDQLYADIKCTAGYARNCIENVRSLNIGIDNHLEILPHSFKEQPGCDKKTNVKWYSDVYLASCSGLFGKLGLTYSSQGYAHHDGCDMKVHGHRNGLRLNLQVGKYWHPYGAVRAGIFEGTAGLGVDWWIAYNRLKWLTTFEIFDLRGYNRFDCDSRPHLKWLNRLFVTDSWYFTFGADDFISRCNKSAFIGIGAYFTVPDLVTTCV